MSSRFTAWVATRQPNWGSCCVLLSLSLALGRVSQCNIIESSERSDRGSQLLARGQHPVCVGHRPHTPLTTAPREVYTLVWRMCATPFPVSADLRHVSPHSGALRTRHNHTAPRAVPGAPARGVRSETVRPRPGSEGRQLAVAGAAKMRGVIPKDHGSSMDVVTPVQVTLICPIFTPWRLGGGRKQLLPLQ